MKEKLKSVKTASSLFILHSSFSESLALAPRNISFHRHRQITVINLRNHLLITTLRKTSKIALFSTKEQFVQEDALNLGSKFEYYLTNFQLQMMPAASDKGSQPYSRAYGYGEPMITVREARESKWLVKTNHTPRTLLICKGQEQTMSPTVKAGLYYWGNPCPSHFETPKGVSVWLATIV